MGSRGSDCTKSVVYGRWVAEGEAIRSSRGGRGRKYYASDPAEAGGKKLNLKIWDNCTGHCSTANDKKKAHNREKMRAKLNVLEFILVLSCYRATILARW
jgi:hypothetical protein